MSMKSKTKEEAFDRLKELYNAEVSYSWQDDFLDACYEELNDDEE